MTKKLGAIYKILLLIIGIIFILLGVPSEFDIGRIILNTFSETSLCENNSACDWIPVLNALFIIIGVLAFIGLIFGIINDTKSGRW